ncbi:hypothetical protein Tco_1455520 [Tanacetum coccineum]
MTLTEAAKEAIWLKRLAIESGFELKIVAGIATGALSKAIPSPRFQHRYRIFTKGRKTKPKQTKPSTEWKSVKSKSKSKVKVKAKAKEMLNGPTPQLAHDKKTKTSTLEQLINWKEDRDRKKRGVVEE